MNTAMWSKAKKGAGACAAERCTKSLQHDRMPGNADCFKGIIKGFNRLIFNKGAQKSAWPNPCQVRMPETKLHTDGAYCTF